MDNNNSNRTAESHHQELAEHAKWAVEYVCSAPIRSQVILASKVEEVINIIYRLGFDHGAARISDACNLREMSLDEAIEHALDKASNAVGEMCRKNHAQLAKWLKDYKKLKESVENVDRILKMNTGVERREIAAKALQGLLAHDAVVVNNDGDMAERKEDEPWSDLEQQRFAEEYARLSYAG